jgi:uncharacterized protein (TIGR02466 family)
MHPNQENLFPTPVWGFVLNDHHHQTFDYVDHIKMLAETEPSVKKSNMGGWQSKDTLFETEGIFRELGSAITNIAQTVLKDYTSAPVEIKEMWANINTKYSSNGSHTHSGILSGVMYFQVPENSGRLILINPAVRSDGHLIRNKNFAITPHRLALILFPSWLEHYVEQNLSDDVRISLSFNIGAK